MVMTGIIGLSAWTVDDYDDGLLRLKSWTFFPSDFLFQFSVTDFFDEIFQGDFLLQFWFNSEVIEDPV